jgi:hypothetical protein
MPTARAPPARKPHQIDAGAAADVEHALPGQLVERNQGEKVMQLVEVILVEILEELGRPDGCAVIARS